jgi:hypothetical protein
VKKIFGVAAIVALFVAAFVLPLAVAASTNGTTTANLSWSAPTAYLDGTTLPASDIASYTITYQSSASATAPVHTLSFPAGTLSTTVAALCSSTNFTITVTTTASAVYPNATSSQGGPVPFVSSVNCAPNPPGNFTAK